MKGDAPFESKATEALALGVDYLGVDSGFVTRVDTERDHWKTIVSTDGTDGLVPRGVTENLSGVYCRHTLERDSPLAAHDIAASEPLESDGLLECYHGTTLTVDGEPYGTVCFVAREVRSKPFDEAETMFAELVARLLEHELEHRRQQEALARQTSMINVLDRVLRHNIRNDTTVIRAMGQLLAEKHEDCQQCNTIVEKANDLVGTSETARHLGRLINEGEDRRPIDVASLARDVVADTREEYPEMSLTTELPEELVIETSPALETALWELLENAGEHAGPAPAVRVTVTERADGIDIEVSDDGPGIPDSERDVLQTGTETQLVHGSGLGLWSVYWIVTGQEGAIEIETERGTTVRLSLPSEVKRPASEPQVRRAPDRYERAFAGAPVGLLILDDDGWIVEANDRAERLLNHPEHGVSAHSIDEFCPGDGAGLSAVLPAGQDERHGHLQHGSGSNQLQYGAIRDVVPGQHLVILHGGGQ